MATAWQRHGSKFAILCGAMIALMGSLLTGLVTAPTVSAHAVQKSSKTPYTTSTCAQPPAHTDLTTLSDAQLAVYGLPSRARFQGRLAEWRKMMQHAKHRSCDPGIPTKQTAALPSASGSGCIHHCKGYNTDSPNWAGNIALNHGYNEVEASWTVPCISSSSDKPSDSVQWVGLGGDGADYPNQDDPGHRLVQAGTESGITSYGFEYYFAWYEIYPIQYEMRLASASFPVYCADSMYVYADSNLSHPRQAYFVIEDYSTQKYVTIADGSGSFNDLTDGTTAEWIVERPELFSGNIDLGPADLADFSPTEALFVTALTTQSGVTEYVGQTLHIYNIMYDYNANLCGEFCPVELAHPQSISGNGQNFPVHFDASY